MFIRSLFNKRNILKAAVLFIAVCMFASLLTGCKSDVPEEEDDAGKLTEEQINSPGLVVGPDGTIYLGGKIFYSYGIDLFSTFQDALASVNSKITYQFSSEVMRKEVYKADFELCKEYGIDIVRMPLCSWGLESYNKFDKNPELFFSVMDAVIEAAEEAHVGIIADLFWNTDTLSYYVKEHRSAIGDPESKTLEFARNYIAAVVQRYKDSPAIFGWEVGNEYSNLADLCDVNLKEWLPIGFMRGRATYEDYATSEDVVTFFVEVAKEIRKYDSTRLITTGNCDVRSYAWHIREQSRARGEDGSWTMDWTADTHEQHLEMIKYFAPDPTDTISVHYAVDAVIDNTKDSLMDYATVAKQEKKGLFLGEFGDLSKYENGEVEGVDYKEVFTKLLGFMKDDGYQIACGWFTWDNSAGRFNHTLYKLSDVNKFKLEELQRINSEFEAAGLRDTSEYWERFGK